MGGLLSNAVWRYMASPNEADYNAIKTQSFAQGNENAYLGHALQNGQEWAQKAIDENADAPYRAQREAEAKKRDELRKQMLAEKDVLGGQKEDELALLKPVLG